jgi:predicted nuclease of predicted toxin-antitoxin system
VIFWVDAQLPPGLAVWLTESCGVQAIALRDLGLRDAEDAEIFMGAT